MILEIILIILLYILVIFVLSRLIIPHLGFKKEPLPTKIPKSMQQAINKIKKRSKNKNDFLKKSYYFFTGKYCGSRLKTFTKFGLLFKRDIGYYWQKQGFLQCNLIAFVFRTFLVKSGYFKDDEIKTRHTFLDFNIHQYLKVKINNKWIDIDIWAYKHNVPFGKHMRLFG